MTRFRASVNAAILFVGVCLMLGAPGAILIETWKVFVIYGVAVLGFATWMSRETYQGFRAEQDGSEVRGT